MVERQLRKIFDSETSEHWANVYWQYRELYTRCPSQKVTAHFGFFCWYLLWKWEEISVPGEIFSAFKQFPAQLGGEISRSEVTYYLDETAGRLLSDADHAPLHYLGALAHVQRECPCFFEKETFSDDVRLRLLRYLDSRFSPERGMKLLLAFQHNPDPAAYSRDDWKCVGEMFPERSLIRRYFLNYGM